jgi:hypothetical protein
LEDVDIAIVDANSWPWDGATVVVAVVVKEGEIDLFPRLEPRFGRNSGLTITGR